MAIYMHYGDIHGNASEEHHKTWLEVESAAFHAVREARNDEGEGHARQGGTVTISDLTVTKPMCHGSSKLFDASVVGFSKEVKIHFTRTGHSGQITYLEIVLHNCCVTNYSLNSTDAKHVESLSLNFTKIHITHHGQKDDLHPGTKHSAGFDIPSGKVPK
jgi:type VI secretion system secreted protein Hcp